MNNVLWVGFGGFIGAALRYMVSGWVQGWSNSVNFPHGTLVVNLLGCVVIGLLSQLANERSIFTDETRLLVFIGILGSFTTFSTFSNETLNLMRDGKNLLVYTNMMAHLGGGLSMVWLGSALVRVIWR